MVWAYMDIKNSKQQDRASPVRSRSETKHEQKCRMQKLNSDMDAFRTGNVL